MTNSLSTQERYQSLVDQVQACRHCPSMEGRRRVLGAANGPLGAKVMFVAEAPGRLGGERTGIPFSGDQSGRNFNRLLEAAGWSRDNVFITNAVLCNPRTADGLRNRTPSRVEIGNCRRHLSRTIDIVDPLVVVSLGRIALESLEAVEPHGLSLARDVGRLVDWHGRYLVPLYHVGPRAQLHRPWDQQVDDFRQLRAVVGWLEANEASA